MLSKPKIKGAFDSFIPRVIIIPQKEKLEHIYQKEDNLQNDLQKDATVLGTIQILCSLVISSLGAILLSAPYPSHFNPAVSTILMSGYPFVGALCFAITGSLSIISGKKSTKPFKRACTGNPAQSLVYQCLCRGIISCESPLPQSIDYDPGESMVNVVLISFIHLQAISSLTSNAVSSVAAGAGLLLLAANLVALGTASQQCDSEKEYLSSLPYSRYYYSIYEVKDCFLAGVSLTGALVVMLTFTVLELLLAAYASVLWWKQIYSNNTACVFSLPQSQDHTQHVKKSSSRSWI